MYIHKFPPIFNTCMYKSYMHTLTPVLHTDDTCTYDTKSNDQTSPLPQSDKALPSQLT